MDEADTVVSVGIVLRNPSADTHHIHENNDGKQSIAHVGVSLDLGGRNEK